MNVAHSSMKSTNVPNLARSAIAPVMRGGGVIGIRIGAAAAQPEPIEAADNAAGVGTESEGVAPQDPLAADQSDDDEALRNRPERILPAHEAAVEKKQAGDRHHQDERR